ncbi:phenylalanine--tRNA ligase subunit beta, partial [bacterium]|nr:phenylalanine--tRNA ligase subunit beta [bacterium]
MKVSLQWAQSVSNVDITTIPKEDLLKKMGAQLGAIEEVIEWGPRYNGIVVVKVVKCEPHPNADTLHVCLIDDGRVTESVERNNDGYVQVVCGAPNVHTDMLAVWLPPNTTVPSTLNKDPFVLGVRDLRGVMSNGMLASPAELGISDNHDGILEVTVAEVGEELARPGTSFKKLYGMDDIVIDCENKMFTHRPDCFGILGVAREIAGITGQKFTSPDWYLKEPVFKTASDLPLRVNVASKLVPRFMAVVLDNVRVEPSPLHMQAALTRVGIRPINNIVDITNWLMHLTGQPLHAYDYDKLANLSGEIPTLDARMVHDNETITLLNGNTIPIQKNTIVIATDKQSVALAGVMGGASTEVDSNTKSIVLEVATFDMFSIRRTSMRHGLFTDAVTRFTKGQSPLQNDRVLHKAILMMQEIAGATQASDVYDHKSKTVMPLPVVEANIEFVNTRLGSSLSTKEAIKLLENVECSFAATQLQETRSYLKTGLDLDQKIERIGVKIVEKTPEGHYKLVLPAGTEEEYEKLIALELEPGNWCEYVGAKSAFLFKDRGLNVTRY